MIRVVAVNHSTLITRGPGKRFRVTSKLKCTRGGWSERSGQGFFRECRSGYEARDLRSAQSEVNGQLVPRRAHRSRARNDSPTPGSPSRRGSLPSARRPGHSHASGCGVSALARTRSDGSWQERGTVITSHLLTGTLKIREVPWQMEDLSPLLYDMIICTLSQPPCEWTAEAADMHVVGRWQNAPRASQVVLEKQVMRRTILPRCPKDVAEWPFPACPP
jgi:hypothetical protein